MGWFEKTRAAIDASQKRTIGAGVFRRCDACEEFTSNLEVCPKCGHHYHLSGEGWIDLLTDPGSFTEHDANLTSGDPLDFKDGKRYRDRIKAYKLK